MKKIKIIILLFLSLSCFLIIGCEKKDKLLLECNTTIEDTKENIKIDFYKSKTAVRTVTVKKDKDAEEKIDALIKNYCKMSPTSVKILVASGVFYDSLLFI